MTTPYNLQPLFKMSSKISIETNFANCILHFSSVIDEIKTDMTEQSYLELYTHLKNIKDQKWFIRTTDPVRYRRDYIENENNTPVEDRKGVYCKFCATKYFCIGQHHKTEKHRRNVINYNESLNQVNGHHATINNYKIGKRYAVIGAERRILISLDIDKFVKKQTKERNSTKLYLNARIIQKHFRRYLENRYETDSDDDDSDDDDENQCIITFIIDGKTYIETVEFDDDDDRFLNRDDDFIDWIERYLPDGVDKGECMDIDYEIKLRAGFVRNQCIINYTINGEINGETYTKIVEFDDDNERFIYHDDDELYNTVFNVWIERFLHPIQYENFTYKMVMRPNYNGPIVAD
mgnify:CR=1 FL=1